MTTGNIELLYENGRVRYIKYKDCEVLRMIYPALRDENWVTVKPQMRNENIQQHENGFTITFQMEYSIGYKASFEITGRDNTLVYIMKGESLTGFKSKRVGLCVHHPIEQCAGKQVVIKHDNGMEASYIFPELISPEWPFTDIVSMQWTTSNAKATLNFEGDVFETEDQRNWTDDSYKTYSGPQYKTKMLDIKKGDTMMHRVTLLVQDAPITPFPKIGYRRSADQNELSADQVALLKQLPFDHYRVDIDFNNKNWRDIFRQARKEAAQLNVRIELAGVFDSTSQADELIKEIKADDDLHSLLVISDNHYSEVYTKIKQAFPGLATGFGTNGWFADLNSATPLKDSHDFVAFKVSPQVHQDDELSIIENLGSQQTTVKTLRKKIGNKPIHVSPVFFNHKGSDERLYTSLGTRWMTDAIRNFAEAGHVTLFEINDVIQPPLFNALKNLKNLYYE